MSKIIRWLAVPSFLWKPRGWTWKPSLRYAASAASMPSTMTTTWSSPFTARFMPASAAPC